MPPPGHLVWDDQNTDHIARHGVTPEEVEEVWASRHLNEPARGGRRHILGRTFAGRYLTVYVEIEGPGIYYVVTAYPMSDADRKRFRKQGKR